VRGIHAINGGSRPLPVPYVFCASASDYSWWSIIDGLLYWPIQIPIPQPPFQINNLNICEQIEKRGHFAQNAKFWQFSSYHHFKAVRASDFILGLGTHQAFCFTNPMLKL